MPRTLIAPFAIVAASISMAVAQVPQIIHYQGKIQSGSNNFNGTGAFKFSLVDSNGTATLWSQDGTGNAGAEPTGQIEVPVSNGLYSVALGDTSTSGMSAIPYSVFGNAAVRLRIWFNDGVHGFQQLSPDQPVAAVGYAMMAANVRDAAIGTAQISNGAITPDKLAPGFPGGLGGNFAMSTSYLDPALISAGYVAIGGPNYNGNLWTKYSSIGQPAARTTPPNGAVWTGSEMMFWGDYLRPGGARYHADTGTWTALPSAVANSPGARSNYSVVWTGTEMIVWGGSDRGDNASGFGNNRYRSGSRYNPSTDQWTAMSDPADSIPGFQGREHHTVVWTGTEMIVWGGITSPGNTNLNSGAVYNPSNNTWRATRQDATTPSVRGTHCAIWTGTHMIVWGGGGDYSNNGGIYDPNTDTWLPMADTASIGFLGRNYHEAIWTGTEMIVWGGYRSGNNHLSDGARYNPTTNVWTMLPSAGLAGRYAHKLAWTGKEMLVYGGNSSWFADGAAFDPVTSTWTPFTTGGAPPGRAYFPAVWNGRELLVCSTTEPADIYGYAPRRTYYFYQKP